MHVGRIVGYTLLGLVDALIPAAVAASLTWGVTAQASVGFWPVVVVAAVVFAVGAVAGAVSASRGGESFVISRSALKVWDRLWWV